ncbi:MAG: DUF3226 domain-containing protein [Gemmataceae bacterium]
MPVATVAITKPKLLLGEGKDEARFFNALLGELGITDVQVVDYGGKTKLKDYVEALAQTPVSGFAGLISLAITRDADVDATAAFASAAAALANVGLTVPSAHGRFAGTNPQVGVWILPDGSTPGMLEDLCLASVQTDLALPCVDEYFQCVQQRAGRQPNNIAKARLHVWLASQAEPDKRLGEAAEKGYWPWDAPAFQPLIRFLQLL